MIDARSLHNWLGNRDRFATWMKDRIESYGFVEPEDYVCIGNDRSKGQRGGWNRKDYLLTLDTAKQLAMVERTDIGRDTRRSTTRRNPRLAN